MRIPTDIPKRVIGKLRRFRLDSFLSGVAGVIHIGANAGQERADYAARGLNVLWVEPIPAVFELLRSNISGFANQHACCYLVAAEHGKNYSFHVSNHDGVSSSILDLAKHKDMCPHIQFTHDIPMKSTTLVHLVDLERVDLRSYGALVLDTQGSELLVLEGAAPILHRFKYIKAEAADFESYASCCQLRELTDFMGQHGFTVYRKAPFFKQDGLGTYYDVVYRRN